MSENFSNFKEFMREQLGELKWEKHEEKGNLVEEEKSTDETESE